MKRLTHLWQCVLLESGTWCRTSTDRDWITASARIKHEGLSFLTITLPNFGADLQKGLDQGFVDRNQFAGFRRTTGLPSFLGGFLDLVFDRETGVLLQRPSVDAIHALRQLTLMFGKVEIECSDERKKLAIDEYVQCEKDVRTKDKELSDENLRKFREMSIVLWSSVLSRVDENVYYDRLVPKHGPGSTADRLTGNQKFGQLEWTQRLEAILPSGEYLLANWRYHYLLDHVTILEPGSERPVKVVLVPKTLKRPRIIAQEPTCMQYTQQALAIDLVETLEHYKSAVSPFIGFSSQVPNQRMAMEGSLTGDLATLDLSEASDRVSNQLVQVMMQNHPHVAEAVQASRSRKADVPGHGVVRLAKFASMGSGLCFPVEAMVFVTVVFLAIAEDLNIPIRDFRYSRFRGSVRVYGDDIVVPTTHVHSVTKFLEAFGLRVNSDKSFWTGKFRESCGKEYYDGHDVSIVKVRQVLPTSRKDVTEIVSLVSLRNQLYEHGYWSTCQVLDKWIGDLVPFPIVEDTSPVHGRKSVLPYEASRMSKDLHSPLVRGIKIRARLPTNPVDGHSALLKCFLKRGDLPFADREHLERSGRPKSVDIKIGWFSPF